MDGVPAINEMQAETIYRSVIESTFGRFRANDRPDFRMRGREVRGIVVPGVFGERRRSAWLKIILDPKSFSEPDIIRRVNRMNIGNLRAPRIRLRGETTLGYPWYISDDAAGSPLVSKKRYESGDPRLRRDEYEQVSDVFWLLTENMLAEKPALGSGPAPVIWFDDHISKRLAAGQRNGAIRRHLITPSTLLNAVEVLRQASVNFPAPGTHFSHAHLSNEELRIKDKKVTLLDWGSAKFVPLMYDAAFWVWHEILVSWNVSTKDWLLEVEDLEDAFCMHSRHVAGQDIKESSLRFAFRACLLERMLGAALVDCAEGSPTLRPILEQRQIIRNVRATLRLTIQGLT